MSNHDDFWTRLVTGHSNTTISSAIDTHLAGNGIGESFGGVRTLTDRSRQANALPLPVEAGTKVVFAGNLGAHLTYDDVPADGITGEVVTVKSATGEITHHGGKVFVKWADGKFRPIHATHLRLAGQGKTAAVPRKKMENAIAGKMPPGSKKGRGANRVIMLTGDSAKVVGKDNYSRHKMSEMSEDEITALYNFLVLGKRGRRAGGLDTILKEMDLPEMRLDTSSFANVRWLLRNMGVKNKDHPKYGDAKKALKALHKSLGKKASVIRVASLGDLTQFLKRADGKLVHKSTNDLWSYSKDADGNFLVSRLFDDEGEPLRG